ncbi:uncharacterized protein LOC127858335 isoform X2 [Dreissena polymorpha]|uniref:uncharacterized protein LOC127858335 isoform X2 n=1 Tax=Dreissena polymorpha TaxID=45954 RepID=UPI0022652E0E|nr:uncharacterized protein LOC127858335 isoform X2 [Dreissena polymorpha]
MMSILCVSVVLCGVAADTIAGPRCEALEERVQAIIKKETEVVRKELETQWNAFIHEASEVTRNEIEVLRKELEMLRQENMLLHRMYNAQTTEKELHVKRQHTQSVAFHAYQSGEKCIHDMQAFVYEHVLLNNGNGYKAFDGIFEPPVGGVYVFTWTVVKNHDWYATELVVDGVSRGVTIADNNDDAIAISALLTELWLNRQKNYS